MFRVLAVDDDISFLDYIEEALASSKIRFVISKAVSVQDALNKLNLHKDFCLFLIDIALVSDLKDNLGYNLSSKIRSIPEYARTPIIFISGFNQVKPTAINDIHCHSFLTKPVTQPALVEACENAFETSSTGSPVLTIRDINGKMSFISISDIMFITSKDHEQTYHMKKSKIIGRRNPIKKIQSRYQDDFTIIDRNILVNNAFIEFLLKDTDTSFSCNDDMVITDKIKEILKERIIQCLNN